MKKTYLIVITTFLAFTFTAKAQFNTLNQLNNDELLGISFNKISLGNIMEISGNDQKAEVLFGKGNFDSFQNETCPFLCRDYKINNNALYVSFEKSNDGYFFSNLFVNNHSIQVKIKNVTASIGDLIDIFKKKGHVIDEKNNWVVFIDEQTATIDITFYFNPTTRKITNIKMHTY